MPEMEVKGLAQVTGGERLQLKQLLAGILTQVEDQVTQVEQGINQLLPELAEGITSAQDNGQIAVMVRELVRLPPERIGDQQVRAALAAAYELSWRQERIKAQARQKALEQCVTDLVQAARAGTELARQGLLTEGLAAAQALLRGEGGDGW